MNCTSSALLTAPSAIVTSSGTTKYTAPDLVLVDRSQEHQPDGDREPARRGHRGDAQQPVAEGLASRRVERLGLRPLAPRDVERGAQVGERVAGRGTAGAHWSSGIRRRGERQAR
jgi:hypothetical protein